MCHFICVQLFATLWTVARQAPLSMGILQARILEWIAMSSSMGTCPFQPRNGTRSPTLQAGSLLTEPPGSPILSFSVSKSSQIHYCNINPKTNRKRYLRISKKLNYGDLIYTKISIPFSIICSSWK